MMIRQQLEVLICLSKEKKPIDSRVFREKHKLPFAPSSALAAMTKPGWVASKGSGDALLYAITPAGKDEINRQLDFGPLEQHLLSQAKAYGGKGTGIKRKKKPAAAKAAAPPPPPEEHLNVSDSAESLLESIGRVVQENAMYRDALVDIRETINALLGDAEQAIREERTSLSDMPGVEHLVSINGSAVN